MLQMIRRNIAQIQVFVDELSNRIKDILSKYENAMELLKEIPGFSTKEVEDLVSEIGLDMSAFPSEKHLASWAGICPGNNESAGKKSGRITHGNKQVKAVLTESAWAATRTKNTFFSERYHRISARRGKKCPDCRCSLSVDRCVLDYQHWRTLSRAWCSIYASKN